MEELADLPPDGQRPIAQALLARWSAAPSDWRTWSWSRSRANGVVVAHREELARAAAG